MITTTVTGAQLYFKHVTFFCNCFYLLPFQAHLPSKADCLEWSCEEEVWRAFARVRQGQDLLHAARAGASGEGADGESRIYNNQGSHDLDLEQADGG